MTELDQQPIASSNEWIGCSVAVLAVVCIVLMFMSCVVAGVLLLECETGDSSPEQSRVWFETVVYHDASLFTEIQHYTQQRFDNVSHHFRFRFSDPQDLEMIIHEHRLTRSPSSSPTSSPGVPALYGPRSATALMERFAFEGDYRILLTIDRKAGVAYFDSIDMP
jgi:hypothetical protein